MSAVKDMAMVLKGETAIAEREGDTIVGQIVQLAANPSMDVAKLEKLIDMQERVMRSQAEAAFNAAFATMQGAIPTVIERSKGDKNMTYAALEDIVEAIRPILKEHGFALSHRTEWPDGKGVVRIVGILSHQLGHSRQSEFVSAADNSGSKNAIQALGSTISYGRRYTTNDLLGIVTRKQDDDGKATEQKPAPEGFENWLEDFRLVSTEQGLQAARDLWRQTKVAYREYAQKYHGDELAALRKAAK